MGLSKTAVADKRVETTEIIGSQGEEVVMGLSQNQNAMMNIINLLTDMYSNPIEATVREVVSNAVDATVAAGSKKPVEVTTPTMLNPYFIVKDYGTGMSLHTVKTIYSQYGASTKEDDFTQIGAKGLGAKAPLAYCTEYMVETTKDGVTTTFSVGRKSHGNFTKIFSSKKTEKSDGTKISIPARMEDTEAFYNASKKYEEYAVDVPLKVDGELLDASDNFVYLFDMVLEEESGVTGRVWIEKENLHQLLWSDYLFGKHHYQNSTFNVMHSLSGWPYENPYSTYHYNSIKILVELKPGVVDYASSRDAITANDRAETLYKRVEKEFESLGKQIIYDHIVESFKEFSSKEMNVLVRRFVGGKVLRGISDGDTSWSYDGITIRLDDFVDSEGVNHLERYHNAFADLPKDAMAVLSLTKYSYYSHSEYRVYDDFEGNAFDSNLKVSSGRSVTNITDNNLVARNAVKSGEYSLSVAETIIANVSAELEYGYRNRSETKYLLITDVSEDNLPGVLRSRLTLSRNGYENSHVFLTDKKADEFDFSNFKDLFEVEVKTAKELVEWVKEVRPKAEKKSNNRGEKFRFYKVENPRTISNLRDYETSVLSLSEIMDDDAHIYFGSYWDVQNTIYGAVNSGVEMDVLYVPEDTKRSFLAADYEVVKGYENIIISKTFDYRANIVKELKGKHSYYGEFFDTALAEVPFEYLKDRYVRSTFSKGSEFLSLLEGVDEELLDAVKTSEAPYSETEEWESILGIRERVVAAIEIQDPVYIEKMSKVIEYFNVISGDWRTSREKFSTEEIMAAVMFDNWYVDHSKVFSDDAMKSVVKFVANKINGIWRGE